MEFIDVIRGSYIILDTETTGLNPGQDGITEICALFVENGNPVRWFHTLINPERPIPKEVIDITGITDDMVYDKPKIKDVIGEFRDFLQDYTIIGHNIRFDVSFINEAYKEYLNKSFSPNTICTLNLSKSILPNLSSYKLSSIANYLGISHDISKLHRAKNDVVLNYKVFVKLMVIKHKKQKFPSTA